MAEAEETRARMVVPKWLKAGLFEGLLRQHVQNYSKVMEFKAGPALAAGENYSTVMLRITMKVELTTQELKEVSYMMKVPHQYNEEEEETEEGEDPEEDDAQPYNNTSDVEVGMYREVLPEYEALYRQKGLMVQFGPRCHLLPANQDYVLLDDLKPRGFRNASRHRGLDMRHMKAVLEKMAMLHAASAKRIENKGRFEKKYEVYMFTNAHRVVVGNMYSIMKEPLLECLKEYSGNEAYIHKVEKLHTVIIDEIFRFAEADPNEFNVLNHGDCWTNNIMFKYDDENELEETFFVDHQLPRYASPAIDLIYFIVSSAEVDIKLRCFDYFVKYYYDHLVKYLKLLRYTKEPPTLKELHMAIIKYGVNAYSTTVCVMAVGLLPPTGLAHFRNLFNRTEEGEKFRKLMFSNETYRAHAEPLFHWLDNRGALECTKELL